VMIIEEVSPTLTCVASGDGFQFELLLRADPNLPAITKVRVGPYAFKPEYQPTNSPFSMKTDGPDNGFWLNTGFLRIKCTPIGWSNWRWEQDVDAPHKPWYLVSRGSLSPGKTAMFKYTSMYTAGGIRAGLEIYRGDDHSDYGVTGPNYEHFLVGDH